MVLPLRDLSSNIPFSPPPPAPEISLPLPGFFLFSFFLVFIVLFIPVILYMYVFLCFLSPISEYKLYDVGDFVSFSVVSLHLAQFLAPSRCSIIVGGMMKN